MKFKVKFRINASNGKNTKFSINIEEGASFSVQPKALGLDELDSVLAVLKIDAGRLTVGAGDPKWKIALNGGSAPNRAVRVGDFIQVGTYALEFLEVPMPAEEQADENATRFIDISEAQRSEAKAELKIEAKPEIKTETKKPEPWPVEVKAEAKPKVEPKVEVKVEKKAEAVEEKSEEKSVKKPKLKKKSKQSKREARRQKRQQQEAVLQTQKSEQKDEPKKEDSKSAVHEEPVEAQDTGSSEVEASESHDSAAYEAHVPKVEARGHSTQQMKNKTGLFRFDEASSSTSMHSVLPGLRKMRWVAAGVAFFGLGLLIHVSTGKKAASPEDADAQREPANAVSEAAGPVPISQDSVNTAESPLDREAPAPDSQQISKELEGLKFVRVPQAPVAAGANAAAQPEAVYEPSTGSHVKDQFFTAVKSGDLATAQKLVSERKVDVNFTLERGRTPLMVAAQRGQLKMVKYLLGRRANVDARDPEGTTALMLATHRGFADVVEYLLHKGANPTLKNDGGEKAYDIARRWNYGKISRMLRDAEKSNRAVAGKSTR